jgi:putative membrane protein
VVDQAQAPPDDPRRVRPGDSRQRDHLANERTLLAWVRLSVSLFAFGFVIARFGLFLSELELANPVHTMLGTQHSLFLGLAFVATGLVVAVVALSHYLAVERDIEAGIVTPRRRSIYLVVGICVLGGLLLIGYMAFSWPAW